MNNHRSHFRRTVFAVGCIVAGFPFISSAHAFLDHSDPGVGSTIDKSPSAITVWFTQELEPTFSAIEVDDTNDKQIDKKDSHLDEKDAKQLSVSLPDLPPGTYKVSWHVVSKDTHKTQGTFKFEVKP